MSRNRKAFCFISILLILLLLPACISGDTAPGDSASPKVSSSDGTDFAQLDGFITEKLNEGGIPGLSAAIVVKGNVIWSEGFGLADKNKGTSFTADTVMCIASVSKTLIGCALMIAKERGFVDLDEDINTYLKDFSVHNPYDEDDTITLRELATHTSGIVDNEEIYENSYFAGRDSSASLESFFKSYLSAGSGLYDKSNFLDTSEGRVYRYSNFGASFAAYILECATGEPFTKFTEENIFAPLNMDDTSWLLSDTDLKKHATLYDEQGTAVRPYGMTIYPSCGLRTSANDLSRFLAMVMNGGELDGVRVMQGLSVDEMLRLQFDEHNKPKGFPIQNEGIFWQTDVDRTDIIGHTGGIVGVSTYMALMPNEDIGVLVLANSSGTDDVTEAMKLIIKELMRYAYKISNSSEQRAVTASAGVEGLHKVKETERFVYYCAPGDIKTVDAIDELLEEKCPEISETLEYEYKDTITVEIYPDQESYDKSAASKGVKGSPAYSDQGLIILVSPDSPIKVLLPYEERLMMAVHEYVHITLGAINSAIPIWLNEGIASYLGSADNYDSFCLYAFPKLAEINFDMLWGSYYELPAPDVYSCSAVRFIIERFRYNKLNELIRDPDDFENILSMTKDKFSAIWNDYIRQNFKKN